MRKTSYIWQLEGRFGSKDLAYEAGHLLEACGRLCKMGQESHPELVEMGGMNTEVSVSAIDMGQNASRRHASAELRIDGLCFALVWL